MNVELGYVGNKSNNLMNNDIANFNAVPLGAMPTTERQRERVPAASAYGDLNVFRHSAYANYHGLQALLSRQRGNFNFTAPTRSPRRLASAATSGSAGLGVHRARQGATTTGVLGTDRTHVATGSFSWLLKEFKDNRPSTPSSAAGSSPASRAT